MVFFFFYSGKEETMQCFSNVIETYNTYSCDTSEKEATIIKAIILAARNQYSNIEHCFGKCPKDMNFLQLKFCIKVKKA